MEEWNSLETDETFRILNFRNPGTTYSMEYISNSRVIVLPAYGYYKMVPTKRTPDPPAPDKPVTTKRLCVIDTCAICWDILGENPLAATKCGHVFCRKCLERYLLIKKKCPTCREPLTEPHAYHILCMHFETLTIKA